MNNFSYKGKTYELDSKGFLLDFDKWDNDFAEGMAPKLKIAHGLTKEHWDVIHSIRIGFKKTDRCPLVYETCKANALRLRDLERLFPTGYLRGACKLAGITSKVGHIGLQYHPTSSSETMSFMESYDKTYTVDVRGFLVNPDEWDELYAVYRAYDMKINGGKLTDKHWQIIMFLRKNYQNRKKFLPFTRDVKRMELILKSLRGCFRMDIIGVQLRLLAFGYRLNEP